MTSSEIEQIVLTVVRERLQISISHNISYSGGSYITVSLLLNNPVTGVAEVISEMSESLS